MKVIVNEVVNKTKTIKINRDSILGFLRDHGVNAPDNCSVTFTVPSGADWSSTAVDVDDEYPITVSWKEELVRPPFDELDEKKDPDCGLPTEKELMAPYTGDTGE